MSINFQELRSSHLYQLGTLSYLRKTDTLFRSEIASFDIVSSPERILVEPLRQYRSCDISVNTHLYRLLDNTNPPGVTELLVEQWKEVQTIVNQLPLKPHAGLMIMQPAGVPVRDHIHGGPTKQILTFTYCFPETRIENNEPSHLLVGDEPRKEYFPDSNKAISMFLDNERHATFSNEWRFYWAYDFANYFEVPDELISEFSKFNWNKRVAA